MENQNRWILNPDVVAKLEPALFKDMKTFTIEELREKLSTPCNLSDLIKDGMTCSVLPPGSHWQKGKIRIVFEFIPDQQS